jgi:hypothetical protein
MVLHLDIADHFKKWLEIRQPASDEEILFPVSEASCGVERKTSDMMAFDLMAARRFWIAETDDENEQKKRQASDFLKYQDTDGKFADFHHYQPRSGKGLAQNGTNARTTFGHFIDDEYLVPVFFNEK